MPQEMDRSRPATAQTGAAKAVTVTAMEPSFADQLGQPRAVVIDPTAASQSPSIRAGAQSRRRAWFSRRHKGGPPAQPTLPRRMVIGPRIELAADDPLADYLMEVAGAVDIRELEFDRPALTALKDSGAVLIIPLMRTGSPASQETGSGNHITGARATHTVSRLTGGLADKPTAHSGEGIRRNAGEGSYGRAMNSGGIGMLVTLLVRANRQHKKLAAFGLSDHYREIFELTRLDEAITIYDNERSALVDTAS